MDIHAERMVFFVNVPKEVGPGECQRLAGLLQDAQEFVTECRLHSRDNGKGRAIIMVEALTQDEAGAARVRALIQGA